MDEFGAKISLLKNHQQKMETPNRRKGKKEREKER